MTDTRSNLVRPAIEEAIAAMTEACDAPNAVQGYALPLLPRTRLILARDRLRAALDYLSQATKLIALAEYAARERITYNLALRRALRAEIPAERLSGRWYVHSDAPASAEPAAALGSDEAA